MSEYTSNSVTVRATPTNAELITELLSEQLGRPSTWIPSSDLRTLRSELETGSVTSSHVLALLDDSLAQLSVSDRALIDTARSQVASTGTISPSIRSSLTAGLLAVEQQSVRVEHRALAVLTERALDHLGFSVRSGSAGTVTAIEARRGHAVLLARLTDTGAVDLDWLGHGGDECEQDMAEVQRALADHGVSLTVRRRAVHGNTAGGTLIDRAARAGNGDLVLGALAGARPASGPIRAASPSRSAAPQRLREGR